jgi:hypothetical protein
MTDEVFHLERINFLKDDSQFDKLRKLEEDRRLPEEILKLFHNIRRSGNRAAHEGDGTEEEVRILLAQASQLSEWFTAHYSKKRHSVEEKSFNNSQPKTNQYTFKKRVLKFINLTMLIISVFVFIPIEIYIGTQYKYGPGLVVVVAILFISYWWIGISGFSIHIILFWVVMALFGGISLIAESDILNNQEASIAFDLSPQNITESNNYITFDIYSLYPEYYDATVYVNGKPIDQTVNNLDVVNIKIGSKVYGEWNFPWGKMKSDIQQVKKVTELPESMEFNAKIDPTLQKQLTNFINEFVKQCVKDSSFSDRCDDLYFRLFNSNIKVTGTEIDLEHSEPMIYDKPYKDPIPKMYIVAEIKYQDDGMESSASENFIITYDTMKKNWVIDSID